MVNTESLGRIGSADPVLVNEAATASSPSGLRPVAQPARAAAISAFVAEHRNYVWDAYDQGRYAYASGVSREQNPHFHPALPRHVNATDWELGWSYEREVAHGLLECEKGAA